MPITMRWADERKEIFIFDLHTGDWTWRQYDLAVDEGFALLEPIDHDYAAIVLSAPVLPEGNPVTHLTRVGKLQSPYLKLYIIVGGDALVRTLNNIFQRMFPKTRILFASSESEAIKLAVEHGYHASMESDDSIS